MRTSLLLAVVLAATAHSQTPLVPQPEELPRGSTRISTAFVTSTLAGGAGVKAAAPKLNVATAFNDTRSLAYIAYMDFEGTGAFARPVLSVRRSTDGGFSWEPPVAVWRTTTDVVSVRDLEISAEGDFVYVSLLSNRVPANPDGTGDGGTSPTGRQQVWVAASNDQGSTWQNVCMTRETVFPILDAQGNVRTQFTGIDDPTKTALGVVPGPEVNGVVQGVQTRLHVAFNVRYAIADGGPPASATRENNWYQAAEFDGSGNLRVVFAEARRFEDNLVDNLGQPVPTTPQAAFDSDDPHIDADQQVVMFAWQDVSNATFGATGGNNASGNDTYVFISLDGGVTLEFRRNITQLNQNGTGGDFQSYPRILSARNGVLMVTNQDSTPSSLAGTGPADETQTHISRDFGQTWVSNGPIPRPAGVFGIIDMDRTVFGSDRQGTSWIAYEDDRDGVNDIFVLVDDDLGFDWENGTAVETRITDTDNAATLSESGDCDTDSIVVERNGAQTTLIAFNLLQSLDPSNGGNPAQESAVAFSVDGGASWTVEGLQLQFTNGLPDGDWDEGTVAFTANGDLILASTGENDGFNNGANQVYANGTKFPRVVDNAAAGQGITLSNTFGAVDANKAWILLPSVTAPVSKGFAPLASEFAYNFSIDSLSTSALTLLPAFTLTSDPNGVVSTTPLPSFAPILDPLMLDLYYFAIAFDAGTPDRAYTDPIVAR